MKKIKKKINSFWIPEKNSKFDLKLAKKFIFNSIKPKPLEIIKNSNTNIPKSKMNWFQAKRKYSKLNPFGDADKDGLMNIYDCKPFNKFLKEPEKPAKPAKFELTKREKRLLSQIKVPDYRPVYAPKPKKEIDISKAVREAIALTKPEKKISKREVEQILVEPQKKRLEPLGRQGIMDLYEKGLISDIRREELLRREREKPLATKPAQPIPKKDRGKVTVTYYKSVEPEITYKGFSDNQMLPPINISKRVPKKKTEVYTYAGIGRPPGYIVEERIKKVPAEIQKVREEIGKFKTQSKDTMRTMREQQEASSKERLAMFKLLSKQQTIAAREAERPIKLRPQVIIHQARRGRPPVPDPWDILQKLKRIEEEHPEKIKLPEARIYEVSTVSKPKTIIEKIKERFVKPEPEGEIKRRGEIKTIGEKGFAERVIEDIPQFEERERIAAIPAEELIKEEEEKRKTAQELIDVVEKEEEEKAREWRTEREKEKEREREEKVLEETEEKIKEEKKMKEEAVLREVEQKMGKEKTAQELIEES